MKKKSNKVEYHPKHFWQEVAKEINGEFKLIHQQQNFGGYSHDHYHLKIFKKIQGIELVLHSTFLKSPSIHDEFYLSSLRIYSDLEKQEEFYFYYWQRGWFSKTFGFRNEASGYRDFDKKISYETNKPRYIRSFLSDPEIRNLILDQQISIFNIQFEEEVLKIKYQTNQTVFDKRILLVEYFKFEKFLLALLRVKLIKPI
jgi:hypothetical protein